MLAPMDATYLLIATEAIPFMRAGLASEPEDAKALVKLALTRMKASDSPARDQHIGARSKVHELLERLAACVIAGRSYSDQHRGAPQDMDAKALAAIEAALAKR